MPIVQYWFNKGLRYNAYQLSLGDFINSELLVVNLNNYYKGNLNYLTSIKKKSRRLILIIIQ